MTYDQLPKRYRVQDPYLDDGTPTLVIYYVVRKTPLGAWVVGRWAVSQAMAKPIEERTVCELRDDWGARFVLDGDGRRFAHETVEQALYSYRRRKLMQIRLAQRSIRRAHNGLHWLDNGEPLQDELFAFTSAAPKLSADIGG